MEKLILKYLNDSLSTEELGELNKWLEDPRNRELFDEYVRLNYDLHLTMGSNEVDESYQKIHANLPVRHINPVWYKIAAAVVVLLVAYLGFLFLPGRISTSTLTVPELEDITLELDNGEIQVISPGTRGEIKNSEGQVLGNLESDRITYNPSAIKSELVYNTIRVPFGRTFEVVLSDGTAVHLQAGTNLRFPALFSDTEYRKVFLEGEAYFNVFENEARPFIVNADRLNVEVTGTAFNVSAYSEDMFFDVVLEEGGVGMYMDNQTLENATLLQPGYIGSFSRKDHTITTEIVNTSIYTGWREGKLTFRNMNFDNILRKLERHYNIKMINQNKKLGQEIFNASFDKDEPIENVLEYFNESYKIQFYIDDNSVIIQ